MSRSKRENRNTAAVETLAALGGVDLRRRAEAGELPRAYGRDAEVWDVLDALAHRRNVLLLGPSGVGKSAVIHEAIYRMVQKSAPEGLWDATVVRISCTALEQGARNTGEWSARLGTLVGAVAGSRHVVIYLDDIWTLREAGRYAGHRQSFATFLLPYIESKKVVLLGESTPENYTRRGMDAHPWDRGSALADDYSLMSNFTVVTLEEPDAQSVRTIVRSVADGLERKAHLRFDGTASERVIELTRRFLVSETFPGKAVRLLEEIGRRDGMTDSTVTAATVADAFAALTSLPAKIFSDTVPLAPDDIHAYFAERIVGQDEAIDAVVDRVTLIKAELHEPGRPLGVLLFLGPTGSGKTYMAKTLAQYVFGSEDRLVRLDMSEFKVYGSVSSLSQQLVAKLSNQTFSVLLLDEVEKADSTIFDLFLQAFGDGRLTDPGSGRMIDLRNTLVVMTSNLGGTFRSQTMGFARAGQPEVAERERVLREVEDYFRPEFINRLDSIVVFRPLDAGNMRQIARRELGGALQREGVMRRNILLDFQEDVLDVLVEAGFSETYGARPLKRAIDRLVLLPLARRIAAEPDLRDQLLEFVAPHGQIGIVSIPLAPAEPNSGEDMLVEDEVEWEDVRIPAPPPLSVRQLRREIDDLVAKLSADIDSTRFRAIAELKDKLLSEMVSPAFWDDQEHAHAVNRTVYHLDRTTSRLLDLQRSLESLPVPRESQPQDPAFLSRLTARVRTLQERVDMAELELLATDADSVLTTGARIRITPMPSNVDADPTAWAMTILGMYAAWADRHGFEADSTCHAGYAELTVRGGNLAAILVGEAGIHKRRMVEIKGDRKRTETDQALVEVLPLGDDENGTAAPSGALDVSRLYSFSRSASIRDPRTGRRSSRVRDVLSGDLDAFLLAYLAGDGGA